MNRPVPFVNRKYFQRLLAGLLGFIFLLYIPFSLSVLYTSRKSILNNINVTNQTVLQQLKQSYSSFSDSISSLANSIFWRNDIQRLLYFPGLSYEEVYFTLKELYGTFIVSHPSLQSICLYNQYDQKFYSVTSTGVMDETEFLEFVDTQEAIRPLTPILHQITLKSGMFQSTQEVFSHFMYQFNDPSQSDESYLVLNQYADQSVSTIDTFSGSSDSVPTATYYVTPDTSVASKELLPEVQEDHDQLLEQFRAKRSELPQEGTCYKDEVNGKQYLVSYVYTKSDENALVIIQDYELVFAELNILSKSLYLIATVVFLAALVLAFLVSRRLYQPIGNVFDFFSQQAVAPLPAVRNFNELDMIKSVYLAASERSKRLENRDNRYRPIALQYGLSSLMLRSDARNIEQFRRAHPTHWLTTQPDGSLMVVLIQPQFSSVGQSTADMELSMLLYGVQNVVEELLEPNYYCASFRQSGYTLSLVVRPKSVDDPVPLLAALEQTSSVMEEHFKVYLAGAVSSCGTSMSALSSLLREATTCLSYAFLFGPIILTYDHISANEQNTQTAYPAELDARLEEAIEKQDLDQCKAVLSEIKSILRMFNTGNAIICTIALLNQIHRLWSKQAKVVQSSLASTSFRTVYSCISGSGSIDQCFDAILCYIHAHLSDQTYESENHDELFVNAVLEFIQNSYFDVNLSSQMIADYLGFNNRYMMKKFKALTGSTLNEYIMNLRMKTAAALLRDTQAPISSISEQVGIDNLSYFYRQFKRIYSCTPTEYRAASTIAPHSKTAAPD